MNKSTKTKKAEANEKGEREAAKAGEGLGADDAGQRSQEVSDVAPGQSVQVDAKEPSRDDLTARIEKLEVLATNLAAEKDALKDQVVTLQQRNMELQNASRAGSLPQKLTRGEERPKDPYEMEIPAGDLKMDSGFDPTLFVEVARVPYPGIVPTILTYTPEGATIPAHYAPKICEDGYAHYKLPRNFGAAQLRNDGGMKFVLCNPQKLIITKRGERGMGERYVEVTASRQPVFPA